MRIELTAWEKGALLAVAAFSLWAGVAWHVWIVLWGYLCMSLLTFGVYAWDKRKAIVGGWRTPEKTLHLLELLGGWPGGLLAQALLRHKNQKASYQRVFWGIASVHFVLWLGLFMV